MPAILTDTIKKQILDKIITDFADSDVRYFAAIGRSEDWNDSDTVVLPTTSPRTERNARLTMQSAKNITDLSFCVARNNWTLGTTYSAYDDNTAGLPTQPFYAMNSNQQVYICLRQGSSVGTTGSQYQPTAHTNGQPFDTADGYRWKFLYSIGALRATKFLSSAFMPVQVVPSDIVDPLIEEEQQRLVQNIASDGQIIGYVVENGGNNYSTTPNIVVNGNGTGAENVPVILNNRLVRVDVRTDSAGNLGGDFINNTYQGKGYDYADAEVIATGSGSGAIVRPVFAPKGGLGLDPRVDLKSAQVMFNTKFEFDEGGEFLIDQDFRQISLLKNMKYSDSDGVFTESVGSALKYLKLSALTGTYAKDVIVQGGSSLAKAHVDNAEDSDLFFHQSEYTGFKAFQTGESLSVFEGGGSVTGVIDSILNGKVDPLSGELLYIDNRAAVVRSSDQKQDIKIVIQL